MFGFLKRHHPEPPAEPAKGVGVWALDDVIYGKQPQAEYIVTDLGGGKRFHTWKAAEPTDAERERAEAAALAEFNQAMAPGMRQPSPVPRRSVFDRAPDPDRFPM